MLSELDENRYFMSTLTIATVAIALTVLSGGIEIQSVYSSSIVGDYSQGYEAGKNAGKNAANFGQIHDGSCPKSFGSNISYCSGYHVGYEIGYNAAKTLR